MTNSCWLRVSTFAHRNDFDATFWQWKSRGDHPLAFGIDVIVINSSKIINMTLDLQQQSREPIIVEVCQPLQRSLRKSYPQQFHLNVSRRWEFQLAIAWRASLFDRWTPPKCVLIMVAINHTAGEMIIIHWAEMRLLGIVTLTNHHFSDVTVRFPFIQLCISNFARWPITGWWYTYPSEKYVRQLEK